MAKRFRDTDRWRQDVWYRKLPPRLKVAWDYLNDECDGAGVIGVDDEVLSFNIGEPVTRAELVQVAGPARVLELPDGRIWLIRFCPEQYGKMSVKNRAQRGIMERVLRLLADLPLDSGASALVARFQLMLAQRVADPQLGPSPTPVDPQLTVIPPSPEGQLTHVEEEEEVEEVVEVEAGIPGGAGGKPPEPPPAPVQRNWAADIESCKSTWLATLTFWKQQPVLEIGDDTKITNYLRRPNMTAEIVCLALMGPRAETKSETPGGYNPALYLTLDRVLGPDKFIHFVRLGRNLGITHPAPTGGRATVKTDPVSAEELAAAQFTAEEIAEIIAPGRGPKPSHASPADPESAANIGATIDRQFAGSRRETEEERLHLLRRQAARMQKGAAS